MIHKFRRKPCAHSPLLAELVNLRSENEALKARNARLVTRLAVYEVLHWMHAAIVRRDQVARAEHRRAERLKSIAEDPTSVYATEEFRERR